MATNYSINYDDEQFKQVESDKQIAITEANDTYDSMIGQSDKFYQDKIDAVEDYKDTQSMLQQQNTDLAIRKIKQQKDQAEKDYRKEQSAAYVDYQKESNKYGANAEEMADSGLIGTGFSESSQVSMYTAYQNRVATARETYSKAVLNYDNAMAEARLQNSSILAEIAYNSLQEQLSLGLEGFQYKNQLITEKLAKKTEIDNTYYSRWQDVLAQKNTENALAESARQHDETLAEQKRQFNQSYIMQLKEFNEGRRQFNASLKASKSSGGGGGGGSYTGSGGGNAVETDFYSGSLNKDANTYGTFGNGYQPKGISGHGKLSAYKKGGKVQYVTVTSKTLKGKTVKTTQKIWKAADGTLWYWYGAENKYKRYKG